MEAIEVLRAARAQGLELAPPAPADVIARLEAEAGFPLPRELRNVMSVTSGIEGERGPIEYIDFAGEDAPGTPASAGGDVWSLWNWSFAGDGMGNFWALDVTPDAGDAVPVFYVCHDPPVVVFQCASLGEFLHDVLHGAPLVAEVHEQHAFAVWRSDPGAMTREQALATGGEVAEFAGTLEHDEYRLYDLREPARGAGFVWNHPDQVLRHGHRRIFAVERRAKPPLLKRLFGRG